MTEGGRGGDHGNGSSEWCFVVIGAGSFVVVVVKEGTGAVTDTSSTAGHGAAGGSGVAGCFADSRPVGCG